MSRDTLITVLLVIAGIVLAFVLFGAGVRWKSKRSAERAITLTTAVEQKKPETSRRTARHGPEKAVGIAIPVWELPKRTIIVKNALHQEQFDIN